MADRLQLMNDPESIPVPDWHVAENQRRLTALETDGVRGRPADEVFADLKQRL